MKKEHPILFNGPMVRAILEGRKTETRRPVKPQPPCSLSKIKDKPQIWTYTCSEDEWKCPFGIPGDRLWVKETHVIIPGDHMKNHTLEEALINGPSSPLVMYPATDRIFKGETKRPSIHMPRWASRLILEVVNVRVERLQEITEEDARAEGIIDGGCLNCGESEPCGCDNPNPDARDTFIYLWNSINGKKHPWTSNPWVWVIQFKRVNP